MDSFAIKEVDAIISTHDHNDHIDVNVAAVLKNCSNNVPFIGPQACVDKWVEWGVPKGRCVVVKPGDVIKIKDIEIHVLESFDRTALITDPPDGDLRGKMPVDMDYKAVNYLIKTPASNLFTLFKLLC